jgi:UDP-3-O-[3-hydroxymyristoyl] glucosamine N-acyltransferase
VQNYEFLISLSLNYYLIYPNMRISAKILSELLNGVLIGNPNVEVYKPARIEEGVAGSISFLANPKYNEFAYTTDASILLVNKAFVAEKPVKATLIKVDDVRNSLNVLLEKFGDAVKSDSTGIDSQAVVDKSAEIGENIKIAAQSFISAGASIGDNTIIHPQVFVGENVKIGKNCILYPGVKIYRDCIIGDGCILQANVVVGSDGFGFVPQEDGAYKKIPHLGNVVIGNDVEIGAGTTIDRAVMGSTMIGNGVKLDNLIMIAHNVCIGDHTVIAAQAGVAGSTKIGAYCMIGGQAGFVGHIEVADYTKVQAQSGVTKSQKKSGGALYGSPALEYQNYVKSYAVFKQLPELFKRLNEIEKRISK